MKNNLGKVHIYTGNGKGKTTAALGLALRASGAGHTVYLIHFLKGCNGSELKSLKLLPRVKIEKFGQKSYIKGRADNKDKILAQKALKRSREVIQGGKYDVVVLDEIFLANFFKLIETSDIVELIKNKPKKVELVLTGRKASLPIIKLADYVTEMKEIKHPYQNGLMARKGIEY